LRRVKPRAKKKLQKRALALHSASSMSSFENKSSSDSSGDDERDFDAGQQPDTRVSSAVECGKNNMR
jgi:hypothetical protein